MGRKESYEIRRKELLNDKSICEYNRELFRSFFEYEERKLKRVNNISKLDDPAYKTLRKYISMFRNVNFWLHNKPWSELTREDIQKIYDDLEDEKVLSIFGNKVGSRGDYYRKIFKSKPFRLAGKSELAKDVIEYYRREDSEVRFITEEAFLSMVRVTSNSKHLLLLRLAWDFGENIHALLQIKKSDFKRQISKANGEPEYLLHFRKHILKRSRQSRTEPTLQAETVRILDIVLRDLDDDEIVFKFGYWQALKFFKAAAKRSGAKCEPFNDEPTWKDLRSGMANYLFDKGWTLEEVNVRLGHTPGSRIMVKYISYRAFDRTDSKKKLFDSTTEKLKVELQESRQLNAVLDKRLNESTQVKFAFEQRIAKLEQQLREVLAYVKGSREVMIRAENQLETFS